MQFDNVYIISYISPKWDEKTKKKRFESHRTQLEWLSNKGFKNIFVFAQYDGEHTDLVTYLPYDGKRYLPGDARNFCLEHFYSTDQDFCLLLDDDVILYDDKLESGNIKQRFEAADFLLDLKVALLCPMYPRYDPYTEYIEDYKSVFSNGFVLRNKPTMSGQCLFLKNLKKYYNDPIYFAKDWAEPDGSVRFGEDAIFSLDITKKGYGTYKMWNWLMKDMGTTTSSHVIKEANKARFQEMNRYLASTYNLRIKNSGGPSQTVFWSEFGIKHGNKKEWILPFDGSKEFSLDDFFG